MHTVQWIITSLLLLFAWSPTQAQLAYVNPSSITLTQTGAVTVIVTGQLTAAYEYGNTGRTTPPIHVTAGTVQVTYYSAIGTSMSELGVVTGLSASSVATGTLNAGTYAVTSDATVSVQITVILWNENTGGQGISLSDIELAYSSASSTDQAAFRLFIASLMHDQLAGLQSQIDSQQAQLTALQQSDSQQSAAIAALQTSLANLQSQYDQLANQLIASLAQLSDRIDQHDKTLATLAAEIAELQKKLASGTTAQPEKSSDDLAKAGAGLGAAGLASLFGYIMADSDAAPSQNRIGKSPESRSKTTTALPSRIQSSKSIYPHQP